MTRAFSRLAMPAALGVVALGGCATTYDSSAVPATGPVTTVATTLPVGTAADLLPRLNQQTAHLVDVLRAAGNAPATAQAIRGLWEAARREVAATDAGLADNIEVTVQLAERAAASKQLGYAIKASRNMADLVAAFHPA